MPYPLRTHPLQVEQRRDAAFPMRGVSNSRHLPGRERLEFYTREHRAAREQRAACPRAGAKFRRTQNYGLDLTWSRLKS